MNARKPTKRKGPAGDRAALLCLLALFAALAVGLLIGQLGAYQRGYLDGQDHGRAVAEAECWQDAYEQGRASAAYDAEAGLPMAA